MALNLTPPDISELKPRITVFGTGGAGGNAVNNMIASGLQGVDFVVANTDVQALTMSKAERIIQMGVAVTEGLGAGSQPEVGGAAAEEAIDEIRDHLQGAHMVFVTAGMGGGTGTGAAPVVARCAKEAGILTVGVITKPFHFEGIRRMRVAEQGIVELQKVVEAATRIREEVDQDANIIVGATFDESLEGVIRVSVVATGIDHVGLQRSVTEPEVRIAELTQKLRAEELRGDVQRVTTERIET